MLHRFPGADRFAARLQLAQLGAVMGSEAGRTVLAEQYVGRFKAADDGKRRANRLALGAQRCYFSEEAIFSRPALAQPSSTKPLGRRRRRCLPITRHRT